MTGLVQAVSFPGFRLTPIFLFSLQLITTAIKCPIEMQFTGNGTEDSGNVFVQLGSKLELACVTSCFPSNYLVAERCLNNSSSNQRDCSDFPLFHINISMSKIVIENTTAADAGTYSCRYEDCQLLHINDSKSKVIENTTVADAENCSGSYKLKYVKVGFPPKKPSGVICISENGKSMNCTVQLEKPDKYTFRTEVNIQYSTGGGKWNNCNLTENTCYWPSPKKNNINGSFKQMANYTIIPSNKNKLGDSRGDPVTVIPKNIIKPGPLRSLRASPINSTCLNISCERPDIGFNVNLTYRIQYTSKWGTSEIRQLHKDCPDFVLCNHVPYTTYNLSISSKPKTSHGDIYWSPTKQTTSKTPADVPGGSPNTSDVFYSEFSCESGRYLIIYWQSVPDIQKHGPSFGYAVNVSKNGGYSVEGEIYQPSSSSSPCHVERLKSNSSTHTFMTTHTYMILSKSTDKDFEYTIHVQGHNTIGSSISQSEMKLVPPRPDDPKPRNVMAEYNSLNKSYLITFSTSDIGNHPLTGVIYSWCSGQEKGIGYTNCESIYWMAEHNDSWSRWIRPENTLHPGAKWHFAVSLQWENGSSGMVWQTCSFPHYEKVYYKNQTDRLEIVPGPDPSTSFTLHLKFDYCTQSNRPMQYEISYMLHDTVNKTAIQAVYGVDELLISNLKPDREYIINITVSTRWGTLISRQFHVRTKPISDLQKNVWIFVVIALVVLVVPLIAVIWCVWKCFRKLKSPGPKVFFPIPFEADYRSVNSDSQDGTSPAGYVLVPLLTTIKEGKEDEDENKDNAAGTSCSSSEQKLSIGNSTDCTSSYTSGTSSLNRTVRSQVHSTEDYQHPVLYNATGDKPDPNNYTRHSNVAGYCQQAVTNNNNENGSTDTHVRNTNNVTGDESDPNNYTRHGNVAEYTKIVNPSSEKNNLKEGTEYVSSIDTNSWHLEDRNPADIITNTDYLKHRELISSSVSSDTYMVNTSDIQKQLMKQRIDSLSDISMKTDGAHEKLLNK